VVGVAVSEQIKILCVKLNISVSELARLSGKSPQAFGQKMKRESFTVDELKQIAGASGCKYEGSFILPSGDRVSY
jgi:transcriptional regulator with XRE-family HTH domain